MHAHRANATPGSRSPSAARLRRGFAAVVAASILAAGPASTGGPANARAAAGPLRLGGRLEGLGIVRWNGNTPSQDPLARLDLWAEQRVAQGWRWRLSTTGLAGGPPVDPRVGAFDFDRTFQNLAPSLQLDDAFVEWRGDAGALKVGNQKFFWGRLDATRPNDLLSPRQYEDPFLDDDREQKIAVPAIAATWLFPAAWRAWLPEESSATLVWEPIDVPWRFPLSRERWFAPAAQTTGSVSVGPVPGTPCPCDVTVEQALRNGSPPSRRFDDGNVGLRLACRTRGADWAVSFFDGYDPTPNFDVPVRLSPGRPGTGAALPVTAETWLVPAYRRFRSLGADGARAFGPFTVRAEAAFRFRRPWPFAVDQVTRRILADPSLVQALLRGETIDVPSWVERDAIEWGLGADTIFRGWMPLLELTQVAILNNDVPLLVRNVDTRITANLRRRWLSDRVESQLVFLWGFEGDYRLLRTQLAWDVTDGLQVVAGILGIWGDRTTLVGQYAGRGEFFGRIRYSF
ncbi:MAG: hypothetical protein ACKOCT_07855 [Alphaproteobacteria bacterium]